MYLEQCCKEGRARRKQVEVAAAAAVLEEVAAVDAATATASAGVEDKCDGEGDRVP